MKYKTIRLAKLAGWLIFGVVISAFLFILTGSFFGWQFDVVPTESMEPAFSPGGMVVTRPVEPKDIEVGDAILFREPATGGFICHRVINIKETHNELSFQTKGDANEYADSDPVSPQNFIGKTISYIPHVGKIAYLSHLHATPITLMGKKISVAMLIILAIGMIIIGLESNNIGEWIFTPHVKRRQEMLKKRRERLAKRKRRFFTG